VIGECIQDVDLGVSLLQCQAIDKTRSNAPTMSLPAPAFARPMSLPQAKFRLQGLKACLFIYLHLSKHMLD
jgi:hypothetical protein